MRTVEVGVSRMASVWGLKRSRQGEGLQSCSQRLVRAVALLNFV